MNSVSPYSSRNVAVDILRALTMLLMIFVNDLWSIEGYPEWLGHSAAMDDYMGLADIVFPCFLIVVGMSIPYALETRIARGDSGIKIVGHILSRSFALIVMGVFTVNTESWGTTILGFGTAWFRILMVIGFFLIWDMYPKTSSVSRQNLYRALKILGVLLLVALALIYRHPDGGVFRSSWWGILGIIGWTYLFCAMSYLFTRDRMRYIVPLFLTLVTVCALESVRSDGSMLLELPEPNIFDQMLGTLHLGNCCSAALTMWGIILTVMTVKFSGKLTGSKQAFYAIAASVCALALGLLANKFFITSKIMATAPWLCYNIAILTSAYVLVPWLVSVGYVKWFDVIKPAGVATLTCYLVPYVTYSISSLLGIELPLVLRTGLVGILNCIMYAFFVIWLTYGLTRLHIKLKL